MKFAVTTLITVFYLLWRYFMARWTSFPRI